MEMLKNAAQETSRKSYVPVPLEVFQAGEPVTFSLYARLSGTAISCVAKVGEAVPAAKLETWQAAGVRVLYVDTSEHQQYQRYAEAALEGLIAGDQLTTPRKAKICYDTTRELMREAFESNNLNQIVGERRDKWVNNLVTLVCSDPTALDGMLSMLSHDYYTYTHMVNVSVMVTSLAYRRGQQDPSRLKLLSSGGLLHDVGKMQVRPEVLNKAGKMTDEEWQEIRSHPGLGLQFLHSHPDVTSVELQMVYQHHEKLDGSGYPLGLVGTEIAEEARLAAVVDIYDALTSKRPYRQAMPHEKAMAILQSEADQNKIDAQLVAVWRETIEQAMKSGAGS